jgi:hypothetical protein
MTIILTTIKAQAVFLILLLTRNQRKNFLNPNPKKNLEEEILESCLVFQGFHNSLIQLKFLKTRRKLEMFSELVEHPILYSRN